MPESPLVMHWNRATTRVIRGMSVYLVVCVLASGCAHATFVVPADPGDPAPDAASAWAAASAGCADVQAFVTGARASGKVGSQRVWPVSLEVAVTASDSIYIGATVAGNSLFVLAGTGNRATLWLRHDQRVVTATPAAILEAVVGVALTPRQLLGILTGCVTQTATADGAVRHKDLISMRTAEGRVYLTQVAGQWQVRAATTDAFVVEFTRRDGRQPDDVWIRSSGAGSLASSLHLTISDGEVNATIPPAVFQLPAAAGSAAPMTLEDLRAAGPWKKRAPSPEPRLWPVS
jgi:hypothetical protein